MQPQAPETTQAQPEAQTAQVPAVVMPPERPGPAAGVLGRVTVESLASLPENERKMAWINALVDAEVARQTFAQDKALAREFALCGKFDDIKGSTAEQSIATAMVKIQMGRAWGMNQADSVRYIYFVNGKPAIEQEIVASKLRAAGYDWDVEWLEETVQHKGRPWQKCIGCTLWVKRINPQTRAAEPLLDRNGKQVSVSFTEADADHAEIYEKGQVKKLSQKANYQSWARDMYYWRSISRLKKYHAPDVLRGAVTREEALEMMPAEVQPPEMGPREIAAPAESPVEQADPEVKPAKLAERLEADEAAEQQGGEEGGLFPTNPLP